MCDQFNCIDSVSVIEKLNTAVKDLLLLASYEYKAGSTEQPPFLGKNKATIDNLINDQLLVDVRAKSLRDQFNCIHSVSDIEKMNTAITDLLLITSYETMQNKNHIGLLKQEKLIRQLVINVSFGLMKIGPVEYNTNLIVSIKLQRDCLRTPKTLLIIITKSKYVGK